MFMRKSYRFEEEPECNYKQIWYTSNIPTKPWETRFRCRYREEDKFWNAVNVFRALGQLPTLRGKTPRLFMAWTSASCWYTKIEIREAPSTPVFPLGDRKLDKDVDLAMLTQLKQQLREYVTALWDAGVGFRVTNISVRMTRVTPAELAEMKPEEIPTTYPWMLYLNQFERNTEYMSKSQREISIAWAEKKAKELEKTDLMFALVMNEVKAAKNTNDLRSHSTVGQQDQQDH